LFPNQEAIGGDALRGMVVESTPPSALVMAETKFLLKFQTIVFDTHRNLAISTVASSETISSSLDNQCLVGFSSSSGHPISSHSCGRRSAEEIGKHSHLCPHPGRE
jgi:hypothetical protein